MAMLANKIKEKLLKDATNMLEQDIWQKTGSVVEAATLFGCMTAIIC